MLNFLSDGVSWKAVSLMKPSKKIFDLVLIVVLLAKPAIGLLKMGARRWSNESNGALGVLGDAVQVGL